MVTSMSFKINHLVDSPLCRKTSIESFSFSFSAISFQFEISRHLHKAIHETGDKERGKKGKAFQNCVHNHTYIHT